MPRERFSAEDPREWLNRARSNLTQARAEQPDVYFEDLCFQAQQAAEKALKGLLLYKGRNFPYTHDLSRLVALLDDTDLDVPEDIKEVVILSQYAVATRYPGVVEEVTDEEYQQALALASLTVDWAAAVVEYDDGNDSGT